MCIKTKTTQQNRRLAVLMVLAGFVFTQSSFGEIRIWTRTDGTRIAGEYLREQLGKLFIRNAEGEGISIPLSELSASDVKHIRTMIPPEIAVDTRRKKDQLRMPAATGGLERVWRITLNVDLIKKSRSRFDGRLEGHLMMIAQDEETRRYFLLKRKSFFPVFNEGNEGEYSVSASAKTRRWEEYNNEMRAYEYAGHIITVDGPDGKRLLIDTDLRGFEDGAFDLIENYAVFTFFDETGRKKSVPRVRYTEKRQ